MTARATITAAAMSRALEAVQSGAIRVEIRPDGTTIIEPVTKPREDAEALDLDLRSMKR